MSDPGYERLKIASMVSRSYSKDLKTFLGEERYYQVRSTLLGSCNHKHASIAEASPCYELGKKWMKQGRRKMKCPHCLKDMGWNNHGVCEKCGKYCGCSFDPTSYNDYCSHHDPRIRKVEKKLDGK